MVFFTMVVGSHNTNDFDGGQLKYVIADQHLEAGNQRVAVELPTVKAQHSHKYFNTSSAVKV